MEAMIQAGQRLPMDPFFQPEKGYPRLCRKEQPHADEQKDRFDRAEIGVGHRLIGGVYQENDNVLNEIPEHPLTQSRK
jgi:hypothetical protein